MTVAALKPFDAEATCAKCGHDDLGTSYQRNGHCTHYPNRCPFADSLHDPKCCDTKASEHIHRHCRRCHFEWPEAVLKKEK